MNQIDFNDCTSSEFRSERFNRVRLAGISPSTLYSLAELFTASEIEAVVSSDVYWKWTSTTEKDAIWSAYESLVLSGVFED
jgi:hypothetical protein